MRRTTVHKLAIFLQTVVQPVIVAWRSQIDTIINVDNILAPKITSPSKRGIVLDLRDETFRVVVFIERVTKTSAVAPFSTLQHQIHVNSMPHVMVAATRRFHDRSSNRLSGFPEGARDVHLEIQWFGLNVLK